MKKFSTSFWAVLFASLFICSLAVTAAAQKRMTIEDALAIKQINAPQFSPDGKQYLHYLGIANTTEVFEMDEEYALLFENINTATFTDLAGNPVNTTLGLIPNVNANGQTQDYFGDVDLGMPGW